MSKLGEALYTVKAGYIPDFSHLHILEDFKEDRVNLLIKYKLQTILETDVYVKENAPKEYLSEVVDRAKRVLINEVFGEFNPYFDRITEALYQHNFEDAYQELHKMRKLMYDIS